MIHIATRELRNDTAGVLRRVQAGEHVVITVKGEAVAQLLPLPAAHRRTVSWGELLDRLPAIQADPGLRDDLAWISADTTDELGPIR